MDFYFMKKSFLMNKNILLLFVILFSGNLSAQSVKLTSSNLPIIIIDTHGKVIQNEPKIEADMGIIFNGEGQRNNITDPFNDYKGKIGIEIRGSSSQMFPKKQYSVETRDSLGEGLDVSLLGLPSENDWILFAPYNDKSLMRDVLMYSLANDMGRYASRSRYCEVVINGEYMGIYVLLEKVKRNKNRVNVSKITPEDLSGDNLTGGYIIKVDKEEGGVNEGWYSAYPPFDGSYRKVKYLYHYPDPEDIQPAQKQYIQSFVSEIEKAMNRRRTSDTVDIYRNIDMSSVSDIFLISEMGKNVDAYRLSFYMHKNKDSKGGKLVFGPVWDFNLALGNCDYFNASVRNGWMLQFDVTDPWFLESESFQPPFWWKVIFNDGRMMKDAGLKWKELRKSVLSNSAVFARVDSLVNYLNEAQKRNFQKWPVLSTWVWPNAYVGGTYANEINYLKSWISDRFKWMDSELSLYTSVDDKETALPSEFSIQQNYPNPFNPSTVIGYSIPEDAYVTLSVYDMLGREVMMRNEGYRNAGSYTVELNSGNFRSVSSSGIYFYTITAKETAGAVTYTGTKKMVLLK